MRMRSCTYSTILRMVVPDFVPLCSGIIRGERLAKSLLEPRIVAHGSEIVVSARLLAERWMKLHGPPEVGERLVAGVARERGEARVVVMEAGVVRHVR